MTDPAQHRRPVGLGARLAVTAITAKPGFGTDHHSLTATVAIQTCDRLDGRVIEAGLQGTLMVRFPV